LPKYVFEVSITLAPGDGLSVEACNSITARLQDALATMAAIFGKRGGRISAEPPFEQVTGGWLPPDENGVCRGSGESQPIDYEPLGNDKN